MTGKEISVASILLLAMAVSMSCDESLPPYLDPRDVLQGSLSGRYILTVNQNSVLVSFTVKNIYEETFQAPAILRGTVQITSKRYLSIQKTFQFTSANLAHANNYNPASGVLTIDPQDSIVLTTNWNFIDDAGKDLRQTLFAYSADQTCGFRRIALEETFILKGSVKVYDKVSDASAGPTEFSMCHVTNWVNPKDCPPILTDQPCGSRM